MLSIYSILKEISNDIPDFTAINFQNEDITYREFVNKVDAIANELYNKGIREGNVIAVYMQRSPQYLITIFSILKLGAVYVPIDTSYPKITVNYILANSEAYYLITDCDAQVSDNINTILYQHLNEEYQSIQLFNYSEYLLENNAYIIYTSGSTGRPKGVMIRHKSVINIIKNGSAIVGLLPRRTILFMSSISFDMSIPETLIALCTGMKVVIVDEKEQNNPVKLIKKIIENQVDVLLISPSRLILLLSYYGNFECLTGVHTILLGAEPVPRYVLDALKKDTKSRIFNLYGPTETTAYATYSELTYKDSIDIGKPLPNVDIFIIDESGNLAEEGVPGEIYISGIGVGAGYVNDEYQTNQCFIYNEKLTKGRIYKTGDYARRLKSGDIEYLGRMDNQIKLYGHRIELEGLEKVILRYPGIKQCAVLKITQQDGSEKLVVYYSTYQNIDEKSLRDFVNQELPQYMVPNVYQYCNEMPSNFNGKIDRSYLQKITEENRRI